MDDVDYLRTHGEIQSFVFMVDSKQRDKAAWLTPSEYAVQFVHPFANVVGLEVLEASVPRTNYNVDDDACVIAFTVGDVSYVKTVQTGDYDVLQLCTMLNACMEGIQVKPTSNPPEIKSTLTFWCEVPFTLDMANSSMAEVLGFDAHALPNVSGYAYLGPRLFGSVSVGGRNEILSPGIYSLVGDRYIVLRCKEIETSRASVTDNYANGIAKFRLGVVGYANNTMDFVNGGVKSFHPIGRLTRLTLRFERPDGTLYNFRGVNHTLTMVMRFVAPKREQSFGVSSLNPNYTGSVYVWKKTEEERAGDSDDETEAYNERRAPIEEVKNAESRALPGNQAAIRLELVRNLFA